jgi:hypothetical protein
MDKKKLSNKLEKTTYLVKVYDRGELYSEGSAFCINRSGSLITAAHVVYGNEPFTKNEPYSKNIKIRAGTKFGPIRTYKPNLCGLNIGWPDGPIEKLHIDLSILEPIEKLSDLSFLEIEKESQVIGSEVLMAGFPDELELPLKFDQNLDIDFLKKRQSKEEIESNLDTHRMSLLMLKSGMVGYSTSLTIKPGRGKNLNLKIDNYYIDNGMQLGSSGGPVITCLGKVFGVITKRAVTTVSYTDLKNPNKEVPSGSTLAISPQTAIDYVNYRDS